MQHGLALSCILDFKIKFGGATIKKEMNEKIKTTKNQTFALGIS